MLYRSNEKVELQMTILQKVVKNTTDRTYFKPFSSAKLILKSRLHLEKCLIMANSLIFFL